MSSVLIVEVGCEFPEPLLSILVEASELGKDLAEFNAHPMTTDAPDDVPTYDTFLCEIGQNYRDMWERPRALRRRRTLRKHGERTQAAKIAQKHSRKADRDRNGRKAGTHVVEHTTNYKRAERLSKRARVPFPSQHAA